jgi:hypothetical protein
VRSRRAVNGARTRWQSHRCRGAIDAGIGIAEIPHACAGVRERAAPTLAHGDAGMSVGENIDRAPAAAPHSFIP